MVQPSDTAAELVEISTEVLDAIRTRDRAKLAKILLPDFAHLNEVGERQGKDAFIAGILGGQYYIERLGFDMMHVEQMDRVGIVCGVQRASVVFPGGERIEARTAFTDVFVRGEAGWRLRFAASAELREGEGSAS